MLKVLAKVAVIAAVEAALAACGAGGSLTPEEKVADFAAMTDALASRSNTAWTGEPGEMPNTGTATFKGYAGIVLSPAGGDLSLVGDAKLTADFGAKTISGEAKNFFGDQGGFLGAYTGSVAFVNGVIGSGVPNDIDFDYNGALSGQGNTILLDGSAAGKLKGTPIAGLLAASGAGETELLNGSSTGAIFAVAAEKN